MRYHTSFQDIGRCLVRPNLFRQSGKGLTSRCGGPAIMVFRCATFSLASFSLSWSRPSCDAASGCSSPPGHGTPNNVNGPQCYKQVTVIIVLDL